MRGCPLMGGGVPDVSWWDDGNGCSAQHLRCLTDDVINRHRRNSERTICCHNNRYIPQRTNISG